MAQRLAATRSHCCRSISSRKACNVPTPGLIVWGPERVFDSTNLQPLTGSCWAWEPLSFPCSSSAVYIMIHDPPQFHTQLRNFYIFNPTITFLLASDWTKKADLVYPMLDQPFNLGYD